MRTPMMMSTQPQSGFKPVGIGEMVSIDDRMRMRIPPATRIAGTPFAMIWIIQPMVQSYLPLVVNKLFAIVEFANDSVGSRGSACDPDRGCCGSPQRPLVCNTCAGNAVTRRQPCVRVRRYRREFHRATVRIFDSSEVGR